MITDGFETARKSLGLGISIGYKEQDSIGPLIGNIMEALGFENNIRERTLTSTELSDMLSALTNATAILLMSVSSPSVGYLYDASHRQNWIEAFSDMLGKCLDEYHKKLKAHVGESK
jgi:hypothetical protein